MSISCLKYRTLLGAVEALGGTAPPAVTVALDSYDAFVAAAALQAGGSLTPHALSETVKGAVAAGEALTPEVAYAAAKKAAVWQLVRKDLGEHLPGLDLATAEIVKAQLRGDAGDEMFASLQPTANEAIEAIQHAASFFTSDTTPEQVLDLGPRAQAAWASAKEAQAVLDRLLDTVLRQLQTLELLPPELLTDLGYLALAAWVTPAARAFQLPDVGNELNKPTYAHNVPGGRWLAIHTLCGLTLNSPRQAAAILQGLVDARQAEDRERYTRKAAAQSAKQPENLPPWSLKRQEQEASSEEVPTSVPDEAIGYSEDVMSRG